MNRSRHLAFLRRSSLLLVGCVLPLPVWAESKPAEMTPETAKVTPAIANPKQATKAVDMAVAALLKEYHAYAKDGKTTLREKSTYFTENKSSDLSDEAIIAALGRSLSPDATGDSYIKWQLMSGLSAKVEDKLALKLITAYRSAAMPGVRPGLRPASKKELDAAVRSVTEKDLPAINGQLTSAVAANDKRNGPILEYRDALFERLPLNYDSVNAGLEDAYSRGAAGISSTFGVLVLRNARNWAVSSPPSDQVRNLATALRRIVDEMGGVPKAQGPSDFPGVERVASGAALPAQTDDSAHSSGVYGLAVVPGVKGATPSFPPQFYALAEWDAKAKHVTWKSEAAKFVDKKRLSDDAAYLQGMANNPGGGIKFKDPPK